MDRSTDVNDKYKKGTKVVVKVGKTEEAGTVVRRSKRTGSLTVEFADGTTVVVMPYEVTVVN